MYGGFNGTETLLSQRDANPATNNTILSGDIDATPNNIDLNAYHVLTADSSSVDAVLDGFTISGGNSLAATNEHGAGMIISDSSPTFNNLIVRDNTSAATGGGIFVVTREYWSPASLYSRPSLTNITISNNTAIEGGGLSTQNASPALNNVVITDNTATSGAGGGMYSNTVNLSDAPSAPTLANVTFSGNTARGGAGMYNFNSNAVLDSVTFSGNTALRRGGGMLNENASPSLTNVTFHGNTSQESIGGTPWGGGGMMNIGSNPTLNNVTFSGNNSLNGSGTAGGDAMRSTDNSNPLIRNSIFWGDGSTEIVDDPYSISTIANSIVQGGCPSGSTCNPANVYNVDPALGPLQDNGGLVKTMALGVYSAALDWGDAATCTTRDARGLRRPQGIRCDIGAYEVRTKTFISQAANDGWVLESSAGSGLGGGTPNTTATTLRLGDNALNRQYRAVLSFDTAGVPDGASVISAYLMVKKAGMVGDTSPLTWIRLDEVNPYFGSGPGLVRTDFQAPEDSYPNDLTEFTIDWYAAGPLFALAPDGGINKTGTTQFRPRFNTATDNDFAADYLTFYSGNALVASDRPKLIVYYNP